MYGNMPRLLLVDDDARLCGLVREYFEPHGFDVAAAHTGLDGLDRALREPFDAVLLDLMLPGIDGYEVLRRLRIHSTVPVLMLTARGEETDRIVGLEMGADDYLPKTASTRELLARVRAVLRRSLGPEPAQGTGRDKPVIVGNLCVDPGPRSALLGGTLLNLTRIEFDMLLALARACGRVKSREQLLDEASGREFEIYDRSVDAHIASLRRKLGDDPKSPRFIETVRGAGYVMRRPIPE